MALTDARREALLAYCKLTELANDPEVQLLIPTFYADAVGYMDGAGVSIPKENTVRRAQYDLLVNRMVLESWDHRDTVVTETVKDSPAFRRSINQLKLTEPEPDVSDSDTTA